MIRAIGLFFLLLFQILGWTALILLTVILLTFLLVLFVPIRYRVQVHNERCKDSLKHHPAENLQVHVQVHWLLHLLRISASCGPQGFKSQIRAAGIDILKALAWFRQKKEQRHNRRQMKKSMQDLAKDRTLKLCGHQRKVRHKTRKQHKYQRKIRRKPEQHKYQRKVRRKLAERRRHHRKSKYKLTQQ